MPVDPNAQPQPSLWMPYLVAGIAALAGVGLAYAMSGGRLGLASKPVTYELRSPRR